MQHQLPKIIFALLALQLSVAGMAQAKPEPIPKPLPKENLSIKLTSPGKPFRLSVGLIQGNIKIVTHPGKEILVEAELTPEKKITEPNANQNSNSNHNSNTDINTLRQKNETNSVAGKLVTVTENNNTVKISPANTVSNINVVVKIPKSTAKLNLSIALTGEVSANDISGETEVTNPNGPITLTNISGSVIATSVNGNITVTFASVTENAPMAFSTLVGKIDIAFPSSFKANMKIQSDNGALFSDFDIVFEGTTTKMMKVNTAPMYRMNLTGKLTGKMNGGGAEILLKNMMGNIYIRKSK